MLCLSQQDLRKQDRLLLKAKSAFNSSARPLRPLKFAPKQVMQSEMYAIPRA